MQNSQTNVWVMQTFKQGFHIGNLLAEVWLHFSNLVGCIVTIKTSLLTWLFCYKWRCIIPVAPTLITTVNKVHCILASHLFMQFTIKTAFLDNLFWQACWETAQFCTASSIKHFALTAKTVNFCWRGCRHRCRIGTAQWKLCWHVALPCEL